MKRNEYLLCLLWEQGVPGSNPGIPTDWEIKEHQKPVNCMIYRLFCFLSYQFISENITIQVS